jgi:type II secretion system protein N
MQAFGLRLPRPRLSFEWLGFLGKRLTWLYVVYTTVLFFVFLMLTFPTDVLMQRARGVINSGPGGLEFASSRFAWYNGIEISGVRLGGGVEGRPPALEVSRLWVRPVLSALIRGNPYAVQMQGDLYGGEADGQVNYTNGKIVGTLQLKGLDVGRYRTLTALLEEGQLAGRLSGQFEFEGRGANLDAAQASGDIELDGASITQAKANGFSVPDLNLRQTKIKFSLRGGRLELQEFNTTGDINAQGSGQIVLRTPVEDSVLNLRATLQPTATTPDAVKALMALIPRAPGSKPDAPMTVTGTLTHPRLR